MAHPSIFRIPRPRTFLHFVSLRTGTEFITLTFLLNKVSGFYGILALFTGYHLSALQLSMYIYSIITLILGIYLGPHIRKASPLHNLALAWMYILDSLVNAAYTALFSVSWFMLLARHLSEGSNSPANGVPGGAMMNDTAGFTDPEKTVSQVEIIATPRSDSALPVQGAVAVGHGDASTPNLGTSTTGSSALGQAVFQSGSIASLTLISTFWLIRIYFCLIILAYARGVLRQYILFSSSSRATDTGLTSGSSDANIAENPFALGREEGEGWRGTLGRALIAWPRSYWLGQDADDEWVRGTGDRFRSVNKSVPLAGVGERERRARSGTGPPPPVVAKTQAQTPVQTQAQE